MPDASKTNVKDTIKILMQLDERSLLLIDSGARLLAARQDMDKQIESEEEDAAEVCV